MAGTLIFEFLIKKKLQTNPISFHKSPNPIHTTMSTSPQLSDPKTPEESKRKRSPSPAPALPTPMVDGIVEVGFRVRASLLGETQDITDSSKALLDDMALHLTDVVVTNVVNAEEGGFKDTVQLVNTLFEIAAALTAVIRSDDPVTQLKLDTLNQHALEGLDVIGGDEVFDLSEGNNETV